MDPLETLRSLVYQTPDEALRDKLWEVLSDLSAEGNPDTLQIAVDYLKDHLERWPLALRSPPESFHADPTLSVEDPRFELLLDEAREASLRRFIDLQYPHPALREQVLGEVFAEEQSTEDTERRPDSTEHLSEEAVVEALSLDLEALGRWRDAVGHCEPRHLAEVTLRWLQAEASRGRGLSQDHERIWDEVSDNLRDPLLATQLLVELVQGYPADMPFGSAALEGHRDENMIAACVRKALMRSLTPGSVHLFDWLSRQKRVAADADLFVLGLTGEDAIREKCSRALSTCPPERLSPAVELLEEGSATSRRAVAQLFEKVTDESWLAPLRHALADVRPGPTRDALQSALFWNRLAVLVHRPPDEQTDADIEAALVSLVEERAMAQASTAYLGAIPTLHTRGGAALSEAVVRWLLAVLGGLDPQRSETAPALMSLRRWLDDADCAEIFAAAQAHSAASGHPERTRIFILNALSYLGNDRHLHGFCEALDSIEQPVSPWLDRGLPLLRRNPKPSAIAWCARWKRLSDHIGLSQAAAEILQTTAVQRGLSETTLIEQNLPNHRGAARTHLPWLALHLEEAMIARQTWPPQAWRTLFTHPLAIQAAQGLVFEVLTDADSALMTLSEALNQAPEEAFLRIAHPFELTFEEMTRARSLAGDAHFEQLDRGEPDDLTPRACLPGEPMECGPFHIRLKGLGFEPNERSGTTTRARRRFGPDLVVSIVHTAFSIGPHWIDERKVKVLDVLLHHQGQRTDWSQAPKRVSFEVCRALRAIF